MSKSNIDQKLESLGLSLPTPKPSVGIYKSCLTVGSMVYVSGHVSMNTDGSYINGKLGKDLSDEEGKKSRPAMRACNTWFLKNTFRQS